MPDLNLKQMIAILLAVLMLRPYPMAAAPSAAVLGSISSFGSVTVGDLAAPAENTIFAGDLVQTGTGSAVVQYKEGTRVLLAMNSSAQFKAGEVQLQAGEMTFRTASEHGSVFHASSLRLEPAPSSSANVILNDQKAAVSVSEGIVHVVDPTGVPLASIEAGEARLFAMASPAAAASAAPAGPAAPQMGGASGTVWLLALGVSALATSLAIAALVRANNANDRADDVAARNADLLAQIELLESSITTLEGQTTALQGQIAALQAQIAALQASGNAQAAEIAALEAEIASLEAQIDSLQNQIDASEALIADLLAQIAELEARINAASPAIP